MKSYNVLRIIFLLLISGKTTVKALAEDLEVSTRTVKRYIVTIEGLGMPIETIPGRNGGIYFDRVEFNNRYGIGMRELDGLLDAIYANRSLDFLFQGDYLNFSLFFQKLKINTAIEVDFSKWAHDVKDDVFFSIIKRAISGQMQIEFDYYDMYNQSTHRVIDPYKIGFKENNWYVLGVCHLRHAVRVFKIRKMRNVKMLDTTFVKEDGVNFDFSAYCANSTMLTLVMEVSKDAIAKVYEDFEDYEIVESKKGLLVTSQRIDGPSLMPLILSYGKFAKVISPQKVIDSMRNHVETMEKLYNGDTVCLQ